MLERRQSNGAFEMKPNLNLIESEIPTQDTVIVEVIVEQEEELFADGHDFLLFVDDSIQVEREKERERERERERKREKERERERFSSGYSMKWPVLLIPLCVRVA